MKKRFFILALPFIFSLQGCSELQSVVKNLPTSGSSSSSSTSLSSSTIASGLKQALELGVTSGVESLSKENGYFNDELTKILLPDELQKVDKAMRSIGMSSLADKGLKVLNTAASDAVSEAAPIFISSIKNLSISDAIGLLNGGDLAATNYLKENTYSSLETAFQPKIKASLASSGADKIWSNIITRYNKIPLVKPVEANLTSYVTQQAINGLFTKIGQKEDDIRSNVGARTTSLLQKVFAAQK